ncbi:MAG: hypothetical protein RL473_1548 [Actinomycetota bacterium]
MKRFPGIAIAGLASIAAGAIHGGAIGLHAEHPQLARIFIVMTLLQLAWGITILLRPQHWLLPVGVIVNGAAVGGWALTRIAGISWIDGLEVRESPQIADTLCAGLGIVAASIALAALLVGERELPQVRLAFPSFAVLLLTLPAMWNGASHIHSEGGIAHADGHGTEEVGHHDPATTPIEQIVSGTPSNSTATFAAWPRPYDPAAGIDISGVAGVSIDQELRARDLIEESQKLLPQWADTATAIAGGWNSIGDASTGFEHYINRRLIEDNKFLDPSAPESLVYKVDGNKRTLVSAMFIAKTGVAIDDPTLLDFAGNLMQWHMHDNLCWTRNAAGVAVIGGVTDANGNCPPGSVRAGAGNAMVHVWIAPHPCGPFAALEGTGAGRADVSDAERVDMCNESHAHPDGSSTTTAVAPTTTAPSYNDTGKARITLAGFPGVSADQQARAEELIYQTRTILPKFATPEIAKEYGFTSIQDASTGVEHYINWSWINDEHELNPNYPESLVFAVGQGGSRTLVSAMYMVGDEYTLETVPDVGGPLTQWHIHNNLCFNQDPKISGSTRVVGVTSEDGPCSFGVKIQPNPMLHVWLKPQACGPFAALEGIGAGQIKVGEERLCDEVHSHG